MSIDYPNDKPVFSISAAAKLLEISVHTIRKYEKEGLILPNKSEGNQRLYSKNDLERISCIRKAVDEQKISLNGIKTIYSMIPCWDIIRCSDADRENCSFYNGGIGACWTHKGNNSVCSERDCKNCLVYTEVYNCSQVKDLIKNISKEK